MTHPLIGITVDNKDNDAGSGTYESAIRYSQAVTRAGGLAVLMPHEVERVPEYVALCDGLILTGGGDPVVEQFGCATDGRARRIDQQRQAFELGLLAEVDRVRDASLNQEADTPVLGICLGMQLMSLHNGATLDQYMPDTLGEAATDLHRDCKRHTLELVSEDSALSDGSAISLGTIVSAHQQRVIDAGRLRVVAQAEDGTIEAVDEPSRPFYLGVQWHPERGEDSDCPRLNRGVIKALVDAAAPAES